MALQLDLRTGDLNWLYLTLIIVIVAVVLFYLFYFGRLVASVISFFLRTFLWRKHRIWVDIGSIQFSPLGGRLLFRDVRYVGENEQVRVAMGTITWRYWLSKVRHDTDLQKDDDRLPCRTTLKLEGLEWFVYNRGPAYDMLLEKLQAQQDALGGGLNRQKTAATTSTHLEPVENDLPKPPPASDPDAIDWFRESLPIEVQITRGAVVLGNRSTPSLLIAGFRSALGTCGAVKSRSRYDFYKQVYTFNFAKPKIVFRRNHDYDGTVEEHGKVMTDALAAEDESAFLPDKASTLRFGIFQDILAQLSGFAEKVFSPRLTRPATEWRGLPRYRAALGDLYEDDTDGGVEQHQYAKASTLYDGGESIDFTYYADVAGYVPDRDGESENRKALHSGLEQPDIGNGDLAPEWGVDLRLDGGTITYGPWADRQRTDIQKAFFPAGYFDSEPTTHLQPGARRLHSTLKIYIDFSRTTSLRVPTRESSKDWRYDDQSHVSPLASASGGPDWSFMDTGPRTYGWLDVRLGPQSSLSFALPMIASRSGWEAFLEVHMDALAISSSVNYDVFLTSRTARVSCSLPQPLKWDEPRTWTFNVSLHQPQTKLLRDHTFLLRDLVMDWTAGPLGEMARFVPFTYKMNVTMHEYNIGLYLNERNIIDKAAIAEANTMLTATGPRLHIGLDIPAAGYDPPFRTVPVRIEAERVSLAIEPPEWNTHAGFRTERTQTFGYVEKVNVDVNHTVFSQVTPENVDTLAIAMHLDGIKFQVLGWAIKYLIEIKDNYFGTFVHFVTPGEYRTRHADGKQGDPVEQKYRPGNSNTFELVLTLEARSSIALLPQEIHDCTSALGLNIPGFVVHLRNHDYFMELAVNVDPIDFTLVEDCGLLLSAVQLPPLLPRHGWHLDGLTIDAHRLFGPQPRTSVYVAHWEFAVGLLTMDMAIPDFNAVMRVARAFALNYADTDNSLPVEYGLPVDPDVTFLRVDMAGIDANVYCGDATAVNLTLPGGLRIGLDDLMADNWLSHVELEVPEMQLAGQVLQDAESAIWSEVVSVDAGLSVASGKTSTAYPIKQEKQMDFLTEQDSLTGRCRKLYQGREGGLSSDSLSPMQALYLPALERNLPRSTKRARTTSSRDSANTIRHANRAYKLSTGSAGTSRSNASHNSTTYDTLLRKTHNMRKGRSAGSADGPTFVRITRLDNPEKPYVYLSPPKRSLRSRPGRLLPSLPEETVTHMHLQATRPIELVCSPAAVSVAQDIIGSLEKNQIVEHWLDNITGFVAKNSRSSEQLPPAHQSLQMSASLPSIQLNLLQDVLRPGDLGMPSQLQGETDEHSTILSTTHITVRDVAVEYLQHPLVSPIYLDRIQRSVSLKTSKTRLQVCHVRSPDAPLRKLVHGLPDAHDGVALDLQSDGAYLMARADNDNVQLQTRLGDWYLRFVSAAAELITGTVYSWFIVSRDIEKAVIQAHYQPLWRYRHLITRILELARHESVFTEPPFLSRPTVAPIRHRSDLAWRAFAHVRHCYRRLSPAGKAEVKGVLAKPEIGSETEQFNQLVRHLQEWHNWELDKQTISKSRVCRWLFPTETAKLKDPTLAQAARLSTQQLDFSWDTLVTVSAISGTSSIQYFYEDGICNNTLALLPSSLSFAYGPGMGTDDIQAKARMTIDDLQIQLHPTFLGLVRHVARVRRTFEAKLAPLLPRPAKVGQMQATMAPDSKAPSRYPKPASLPIYASVLFRNITVRTYAHGIWAEARMGGLQLSVNCALMFEGAFLIPLWNGSAFGSCDAVAIRAASQDLFQVKQATKALDEHTVVDDTATLFTMNLDRIFVHLLLKEQPRDTIRAVIAGQISDSKVCFPQSLLKLSQFMETWRTESLPHTKVEFDELRRDLEMEPRVAVSTQTPAVSPAQPFKRLAVSANLAFPRLSIRLRVNRHLWLGFTLVKLLAYCDGMIEGGAPSKGRAGLSIQKEAITFSPTQADPLGQSPVLEENHIHLPALHTSLKLLDGQATALASLESVSFVLTVAILDKIIVGVKLIEHDVEGLLALFARLGRQKKSTAVATESRLFPGVTRWRADLAIRGLNVGLQGPTATQYVGADLVEAHVSQDASAADSSIAWTASGINLALSLAQETHYADASSGDAAKDKRQFDRSYRLAFFMLDLHASNKYVQLTQLPVVGDHDLASHLHLNIAKLHAVMQTPAIEVLDDLIDHVKTEFNARKQARSSELEALKSKLAQSLDLPEGPQPSRVLPWIERCVLSLRIESLALAIPLEDREISASWPGRKAEQDTMRTRPAFIVSTTSLAFGTSRATAGFANMSNLSAQFVQAFDQTRPDHFSGLQHRTQNRLLFPDANVRVSFEKTHASRPKSLNVRAQMSGARFDLDASLINSVCLLLDLYELGRRRYDKHAPAVEIPAKSLQDGQSPADDPGTSILDMTTAEIKFVVESGVINLYNSTTLRDPPPRDTSKRFFRDSRPMPRRTVSILYKDSLESDQAPMWLNPPGTDRFILPKITMWLVKRAATQVDHLSHVHADAIMHSSHNTLTPALLPFLSEAADALKARMRTGKMPDSPVLERTAFSLQPAQETKDAVGENAQASSPMAALRNFYITVSLKIDESSLTLTCVPAAEVIARLAWRSGSILVAIQPGTRSISGMATIDQISFNIKQTFLDADCLRGDATDLTAAIAFGSLDAKRTLLSPKFDISKVAFSLDLQRLQHLLCFKMVWLDCLEMLVPVPADEDPQPERWIGTPVVRNVTVLSIIAALRLRSLAVDCKLDNNIGSVGLSATELIGTFRKVPSESHCLHASLQKVHVEARGRLSGHFSTTNLLYQYSFQDVWEEVGRSAMDCVAIEAQLGAIDAKIKIDYRIVAIVQADPIHVDISDDWSQALADNRTLRLLFSVKAGRFDLITTAEALADVLALTTLLETTLKLKVAEAKETLIRMLGTPASEQALRKKAGKSVSKAACLPSGTYIVSTLVLNAASIRLIIFRNSMKQPEAWRVEMTSMLATLERGVDSDEVVHRDVRIELSAFDITYIPRVKLYKSGDVEPDVEDGSALFHAPTEIILSWPSTSTMMASSQASNSQELHYRFSLAYKHGITVSWHVTKYTRLKEFKPAFSARKKYHSMEIASNTEPNTPAVDSARTASLLVSVHDSAGGQAAEDKNPEQDLMSTLVFKAEPGGVSIEKPYLAALDKDAIIDVNSVTTIPYAKMVHRFVTKPLDLGTVRLENTYRTHVAKSIPKPRKNAPAV